MNTRNNQMNQKIIKLVFFTALAIGTAAAVRQQKPQLTTRDVAERDRRCPLHFDNQRSVFYPHETDCTRYSICAENGTLVDFACPDGLEFDADFSICLWPTGSCTSNDESNEIAPRGIRTPRNNHSNRQPQQKHPRCASAKDGYLFPNYSDDCKSFFKCHDGYAVQISCGPDLLFNEETNYCDWEFNVKCRKSESDNGGNGNNGRYQSPNCAGLEDGTMFPNHQSGCKAFFICQNGDYYENRCDGRLLYNERIRGCDWPQNVQCSCTDQCIGNPSDKPVPAPPTPAPEPNLPNEDCSNERVPFCPPQPCPPENCVLQACIPRDEFFKNSNKL